MSLLEHAVQGYDAGNQVIQYSISLETFQGPAPTEPQNYDLSTKISRDTFASVLIDSFRNSRGLVGAQYMFFDWLMENNGFDYRTSLDNYKTAGGWNCFSSEEQDMFLEAFRRVHKHLREGLIDMEQPHLDKHVIDEFHGYIDRLSLVPALEEDEKEYQLLGNERLSGMSKQKIKQAISMYIKEQKRVEVEFFNDS